MTANPLWDEFEKRLAVLGGKVATLADVGALESGPIYRDHDCAGFLTDWPTAPSVWDATYGVTRGDVAIAESGSVILSAGPGRARLASLACEHHLCLIDPNAIVPSLERAFETLTDRTTVVISGPSRTADIEGVLVRGIHGPKEFWVVLDM